MKKSNNKRKNTLSIVMYTIAILLGIYTIFTMYSSYTYISSLVDQGFVIKDDIQNVITYCVGATVPYLFYTISTWSIGYIINKLSYITNNINSNNSKIIEEDITVENETNAINEKFIIKELNNDIDDNM